MEICKEQTVDFLFWGRRYLPWGPIYCYKILKEVSSLKIVVSLNWSSLKYQSLIFNARKYDRRCIFWGPLHLQSTLIENNKDQGGRSWQPFCECKNGHKLFVRRIFAIFATNFFSRNCKFENLIQKNIYHLIVHFLPKKHCFKRALFCSKSSKKFVNRDKS